MAVVVHGTTVNRVYSQTVAVGNYPAGIAEGDILVMAVAVQDNLGVPATPAGWTRQIDAIGTAADGRNTFALYTKTAAGNETGSITVAVTGLGQAYHNEVAIWRASGATVGDSDVLLDTGFGTVKTMAAPTVVGSGAYLLCGTNTLRNEPVTYSDPNMAAETRDRFLSVTHGTAAVGVYAGYTSSQANAANALTFAIVLEEAAPLPPSTAKFSPARFEFWFSAGNPLRPAHLTLSTSITPPSLAGNRDFNPASLTLNVSMTSPTLIADQDGRAMFRVTGEWQDHSADGEWTVSRVITGAWRIV